MPELITRILTLTQPWATLVAIGAKRIETRSRLTTPYRGWIGIHAAKGFPDDCKRLCREEPFRAHLAAAGYETWRDLPTAALVGAARLAEIYTSPEIPHELVVPGSDELAFGYFAHGRKLWHFPEARILQVPKPMRGALSLWQYRAGIPLEHFKAAA